MGSLGAILKHPDDVYPLLKVKMAAKNAAKQIPPEPHWAFCYSMLHKVSRSFAFVIQQLDTELRNAVSFNFRRIWSLERLFVVLFQYFVVLWSGYFDVLLNLNCIVKMLMFSCLFYLLPF